jgi:hypothetical protein
MGRKKAKIRGGGVESSNLIYGAKRLRDYHHEGLDFFEFHRPAGSKTVGGWEFFSPFRVDTVFWSATQLSGTACNAMPEVPEHVFR